MSQRDAVAVDAMVTVTDGPFFDPERGFAYTLHVDYGVLATPCRIVDGDDQDAARISAITPVGAGPDNATFDACVGHSDPVLKIGGAYVVLNEKKPL